MHSPVLKLGFSKTLRDRCEGALKPGLRVLCIIEGVDRMMASSFNMLYNQQIFSRAA